MNNANSEWKTEEDRLNAVLKQWKAVEPQAGFEECVWRRIREAPESQRRLSALNFRDWVVLHPVWADAVAAAAGIAVAVGLAISMTGTQDGSRPGEPLLHPDTLAGSYLAMVDGGTR